jgi:hypothetical protein
MFFYHAGCALRRPPKDIFAVIAVIAERMASSLIIFSIRDREGGLVLFNCTNSPVLAKIYHGEKTTLNVNSFAS